MRLAGSDLNRDLGVRDGSGGGDWLQGVELSPDKRVRDWTYATDDPGRHEPGQIALDLSERPASGAYVLEARSGARHARDLLLVTQAGGVRKGVDEEASPLTLCDKETFDQGLAAGWIAGGMRVKLHVAFEALSAGIAEGFILAPDDLLARAYATRGVR